MADDIKKDDLLTPEEIKQMWNKIDRKMKRTTNNDEISGEPNYLMSDPDAIPLMMNTDDINALGNLSSKKIFDTLEKHEQEKIRRNNRYGKLETSMGHPEIEGILNIYADEATTEDSNGEIIHIIHKNKKVIEVVEDLFARVGIYDKAWEIIFNMCGYGDEFYEIIPNQTANKIYQISWVPREHIERVEKNRTLQGFKAAEVPDGDTNYTFNIQPDLHNKNKEDVIYPFRILHFRIPSSKYTPYGKSIIDSITSTIEQVNLMIKAMLIARVTRAPERRIYNVDVGNLQGEKAIKYANDAVGYLKKKKTMQLMGGQVTRTDMIKDVFGATEDIVLPKRTGAEGNKIETLEQLGQVNTEDLEFMRDRIFPPVGIPRQYLFDDTFANANSNLSSKSVPFAKKIRRIQRYFLQQLYKLATIELKLQHFSTADIEELTLLMNNPSNIDEKEKIEIDTNKWTLLSAIKGLNAEQVFYPDYLIYKDYLKLGDDEIVELMKLNQLQQSGQNIFNFMPMQERPEGAEDLEATAPGGEVPPGEEGGPEVPPDVAAELGTPPPAEQPPIEQPPAEKTPEVADVQQDFGDEIYISEEDLEEFDELDDGEDKINLMKEALLKKEELKQKILESTEKLKQLDKEKALQKEEQLIQVQHKQKMGLKFLNNSGDIGGLDNWIQEESEKFNNYND